ncbi:uncharacterized protein LOC135484734 isoform X2 [Lineus longissimus]|uniref:uncharacterized protein LOC135484734 isoform X2 n=1 Tax=Lineus longissimus TaxID=88925 RepID=UPI00315D5039
MYEKHCMTSSDMIMTDDPMPVQAVFTSINMRRLQFVQSITVVGLFFLCLRFVLFRTIIPEPQSIYYSKELLRDGSAQPDTGKRLTALEHNVLMFSLRGRIFSAQMNDITGNVTSSVLHSFSPVVDKALSRMFPYKYAKSREINAISPAITWYKGNVVVVLRVWLNYERVFRARLKENNTFQDNFLYTQTFNRYMQPIDNGRLLGIPVPKQYTVFTGPYDPRILAMSNQQLLVTFPMPMNVDKIDTLHPYLWDYDESRIMKPHIQGERMARLDTNWVPLSVAGKLHYVYSFDPLRVLQCDSAAACHFVYKEKSLSEFPFIDSLDVLRGGTSLEVYKGPYYLSVAHSSVYNSGGKREYSAHLVLLRTDKWRIIYVSDAIRIHQSILDKIPLVRNFAIEKSFLYPVGLIIESDDSVAVGLHVNDRESFVIRVRGLRKIFKKAIEIDLINDIKASQSQDVRTIQNYVKESVVKS